MILLETEDLCVRFGDREAVRHVDLTLEEGGWLMVAGPNGAGKSTLVNALSGAVPCEGTVRCLGRDLKTYRPGELARVMGVLSQNHYVSYSFTVREVVRLGRYAYTRGVFAGRDPDCGDAVERALRDTGLEELADRSVLRLSGGELQRVFLAQLFAQEPKILLLDEPTNHLDLVYQKTLTELVSRWLETPGRAVLSVMHDLSLARRFGTKALLMSRGEAAACGPGETVFSPGTLQRVYGMDVQGWMRDVFASWQ